MFGVVRVCRCCDLMVSLSLSVAENYSLTLVLSLDDVREACNSIRANIQEYLILFLLRRKEIIANLIHYHFLDDDDDDDVIMGDSLISFDVDENVPIVVVLDRSKKVSKERACLLRQ